MCIVANKNSLCLRKIFTNLKSHHMKIKITIVTTIVYYLLFSSTAEAQTSWLITGNSGTTSGTNFVGTTDSKVLSFRTKNNEWMRIDTTGYVGIGDLSPSYPLEVSGGVSAGSLSSGGNFMVTINANNTAAMGAQSSPKNAIFGAMDSLINILFVTRVSNTFQERMRITNAGLVGIGTSSPAYNLDVQASNGSVNIKNTLTTGYSGLYFSSTGGSGIGQVWMNATTQGDYGGSNSLNLYTGTNSPIAFFTNSATSPHMFISGGGSVGIGIALGTPGAKLDVATTTTGSIAVKGVNSASSGSNYGGYFEAVGAGTSNIGLLAGVTSTATSNYGIYIASLTASANNYSFYNPASAKSYFGGSVGIGTTTPSALLDVHGSLYVNGAANQLTGTWGSDQMFKTNIDSIHNALAVIKQLKPKTYYFDTTNVWGLNFPTKKQYGFIAQDLEQVLPELVTPFSKNADVDSSGNIVHPAVTYKTVYYLELIAFLTKGVQEQQQKIDSLTTKTTQQDSINSAIKAKASNQDSIITSLQNQLTTNNTLLQNQLNQLMTTINNCCNRSQSLMDNGANGNTKSMSVDGIQQSETTQMDVELNDAQTIVLQQNLPNPFAERTSISYYLPDNTGKAQILFYNSQGKLIQSADIIQKGKGTLNVFASDLSNGIYTYTLVVDGKIIETKKMVKQ